MIKIPQRCYVWLLRNKGNHLQVSWSNRYIHYYYLEYVQQYLKPTAVNSSLLLFSDDHMYFDLNMDNIMI